MKTVSNAPFRPTTKWMKMAMIYKRGQECRPGEDFSDEALQAAYLHETFGHPLPVTEKLNGYVQGKKWLDVTVAMWKEDIFCGGLFVKELLDDGYPEKFLRSVGVLDLKPSGGELDWYRGLDG